MAGVNVPFLPGHVMHDLTKTNHRRPQTLVYKLDCAADNLAAKPVSVDEETLAQLAPGMTNSQSATSLRRPTQEEMRNTYKPAIQPAWLKHDRQVLRFFAYYQEPVVECPTENFRIRNCTIQYYLEDGTMQVTEPKVENSGIWPQGPFVKRHRIPNGDGFYSPDDLKLGTSITIYARTFRLLACDEFTKWFYEQASMDIGVEEEAPMDSFFETQVWKKENTSRKTGFPKEVMASKEYTELKLGGNRKNARLQQFLENDRKVLRFYAHWDDPTRYGSRQYFVVHYFLCDDTVEINNAYARNSGRDPYPVFFTRGPLKLAPGLTHTPGMIERNSRMLRPEDIKVGSFIPVYGREFFIYECDDATREFYKGFAGEDMQNIVVPEEEKIHFQLKYPPHTTGIGSEEDSLGSCLQLRPKPPKKDLVKLMTNSDRILRYEARCDNGLPEDAHRKFIIGIFLADDTVAVWEVRQRNSGQSEGKFARREMKINPETGKAFTPGDFFVGTRCVISAMQFVVMRADEYTLKYMEQNAETYPQSSLGYLAHKLGGLPQKLEGIAPTLAPEDFRDAVRSSLGFDLSDQELVTILRHCCNEETAEIQLPVLYEYINQAQGQ